MSGRPVIAQSLVLFSLAAATDWNPQMSNLAATRALMELGVFDAIPTGGKAMTADELAAKTGGEKELIGESQLWILNSFALAFGLQPLEEIDSNF